LRIALATGQLRRPLATTLGPVLDLLVDGDYRVSGPERLPEDQLLTPTDVWPPSDEARVGYYRTAIRTGHRPVAVVLADHDRELILDLFEWAAGSRMMCNYFRFGGVAFDLPDGWIGRCRGIVNDRLDRKIDELDRYISGNEIVLDRCKGVGVLTRQQAIDLSTAGPVLRASGVPYDIRRAAPYSIYDRFDFKVITGSTGDLYDRYYVRLAEMRESVKILKQAIRDLPDGPILPGKKSYQIKVPAGEAYSRSEGAKGELGFYVLSDGSGSAYRYHVRSPSFINLTSLEQMCMGHTIADVVGILGSLDIVLGEVDR